MPSREYRQLRILENRPIVEPSRPGNRHKPGYKAPTRQSYLKRDSIWERRNIVAWDGEGANNDEGKHIYNLLANSKGDHIVDIYGLDTLEIFEFFIIHSKTGDINVIFGGSYDVNMILKDMPKDKLQLLWDNGKCYWAGYRINWAPRKRFSIQKVNSKGNGKTFVLWDVIGYFQSTFVFACRKWLGNLPVLDDIQRMKEKRSEFKSEDIEEVIEYNRKECVLLVLLMERLFTSLDEANVKLVRYDGAGSIAAALLKMNNVRDYKGRIPAVVNHYAQFAYSGGRIEAIKCGTTIRSTSIYRYDINSAYPFGTLSLPSYKGAIWTKDAVWNGEDTSIVAVNFHFRKTAPFYPLWYRDNHGSITYPQRGRGVYWGPEIRNLFKYYQEGIDFEIEWVINCQITDHTKPFEFIEDLFELRKKFKAEGSMASESLKLGLNSIYGKLVQQAGYREGRIPTYHQLLWGGQITSTTRARLFDAAMQTPNEVISFATDAVFTTKELSLSISGELGDWTYDKFNGITIVQAGVYFLDCSNYHNVANVDANGKCKHCDWKLGDKDGKWYDKFRGFDKGSLQREEIIRAWANETDYEATLTRFIGLGSALMATDFSVWATWRTDSRKLDIRPTGKRITGLRSDYHNGLRATRAAPNITPDIISEHYYIEWIDGKKNSDKQLVGGVPLDVLIDEDEDGSL